MNFLVQRVMVLFVIAADLHAWFYVYIVQAVRNLFFSFPGSVSPSLSLYSDL